MTSAAQDKETKETCCVCIHSNKAAYDEMLLNRPGPLLSVMDDNIDDVSVLLPCMALVFSSTDPMHWKTAETIIHHVFRTWSLQSVMEALISPLGDMCRIFHRGEVVGKAESLVSIIFGSTRGISTVTDFLSSQPVAVVHRFLFHYVLAEVVQQEDRVSKFVSLCRMTGFVLLPAGCKTSLAVASIIIYDPKGFEAVLYNAVGTLGGPRLGPNAVLSSLGTDFYFMMCLNNHVPLLDYFCTVIATDPFTTTVISSSLICRATALSMVSSAYMSENPDEFAVSVRNHFRLFRALVKTEDLTVSTREFLLGKFVNCVIELDPLDREMVLVTCASEFASILSAVETIQNFKDVMTADNVKLLAAFFTSPVQRKKDWLRCLVTAVESRGGSTKKRKRMVDTMLKSLFASVVIIPALVSKHHLEAGTEDTTVQNFKDLFAVFTEFFGTGARRCFSEAMENISCSTSLPDLMVRSLVKEVDQHPQLRNRLDNHFSQLLKVVWDATDSFSDEKTGDLDDVASIAAMHLLPETLLCIYTSSYYTVDFMQALAGILCSKASFDEKMGPRNFADTVRHIRDRCKDDQHWVTREDKEWDIPPRQVLQMLEYGLDVCRKKRPLMARFLDAFSPEIDFPSPDEDICVAIRAEFGDVFDKLYMIRDVMHCHSCKSIRGTFLVCSGCQTAHYCNRNCQKDHRHKHKIFCQLAIKKRRKKEKRKKEKESFQSDIEQSENTGGEGGSVTSVTTVAATATAAASTVTTKKNKRTRKTDCACGGLDCRVILTTNYLGFCKLVKNIPEPPSAVFNLACARARSPNLDKESLAKIFHDRVKNGLAIVRFRSGQKPLVLVAPQDATRHTKDATRHTKDATRHIKDKHVQSRTIVAPASLTRRQQRALLKQEKSNADRSNKIGNPNKRRLIDFNTQKSLDEKAETEWDPTDLEDMFQSLKEEGLLGSFGRGSQAKEGEEEEPKLKPLVRMSLTWLEEKEMEDTLRRISDFDRDCWTGVMRTHI